MTERAKEILKDKRGILGAKLILGIIVISLVVIVGLVWGAIYLFKPAKYETVTKISYSTDGGLNYREGIQEISKDQEYYMNIEMQVVASKDVNAKTIEVVITIEQTSVVECFLDDYQGPPITGELDPINNTVTYKFRVPSSTQPSKFRVVFRCKPAHEGEFNVIVSYDDRVDPAWDKVEKIRYV